MNFLRLEFENDVFYSTLPAYSYDPADWTTSIEYSTNSGYILSIAGSTLGVGEQLSFMVDVLMYTDALTDSSIWQEGQVWAQSWLALDTNLFVGDGGSTAPAPSPEPASLLLYGFGLVGVAGLWRRRTSK